MDKIIIKNAKYSAKIGVTKEERSRKQDLFIDINIFFSIEKAASTDKIEDTVNYSKVYQSIKFLVEQKEHKLVETLSELIAKKILEKFGVKKVEVCIKKPNAISSADYAAINIVRELQENNT